jgi:hypothetical protein
VESLKQHKEGVIPKDAIVKGMVRLFFIRLEHLILSYRLNKKIMPNDTIDQNLKETDDFFMNNK